MEQLRDPPDDVDGDGTMTADGNDGNDDDDDRNDDDGDGNDDDGNVDSLQSGGAQRGSRRGWSSDAGPFRRFTIRLIERSEVT